MSDDATRNASVIADTEVELMVIDRKLFNSTIKVALSLEIYTRGQDTTPWNGLIEWNIKRH